MAKRKGKLGFPARLYVHFEEDVNDPKSGFYSADETIKSKEDGDAVAIYELREVKSMKITQELK